MEGLHDADRPVAGRVAQEEEPLAVTDDHGRRRRESRRGLQRLAGVDVQPAPHRLQACRAAVLVAPHQPRPVPSARVVDVDSRVDRQRLQEIGETPLRLGPTGRDVLRRHLVRTNPFNTFRATVWRCTSSGPS